MGVLTQTMGQTMGNRGRGQTGGLSLQTLDSVATRWPRCLRAIATVALLVQEAPKLTSGQDLTLKVSVRSTPFSKGTPASGWVNISDYTIPGAFM